MPLALAFQPVLHTLRLIFIKIDAGKPYQNMKTIILNLVTISVLLTACNSAADKKSANSNQTTKETTDQKISESKGPVNEVLDGYLKLKNALTKDNDKDAAVAATELIKALESQNKKILNPEQAKVFADIEADAREHAEHIASNSGNIVHQREHFETLSQEIYELVKATGAGQKLYYTNCPMYNDNKGANWLSETKDVRNPYLGQAMLSCGSVKEELN